MCGSNRSGLGPHVFQTSQTMMKTVIPMMNFAVPMNRANRSDSLSERLGVVVGAQGYPAVGLRLVEAGPVGFTPCHRPDLR